MRTIDQLPDNNNVSSISAGVIIILCGQEMRKASLCGISKDNYHRLCPRFIMLDKSKAAKQKVFYCGNMWKSNESKGNKFMLCNQNVTTMGKAGGIM